MDVPIILSKRFIKAARKEHECADCKTLILPGDPYWKVFGYGYGEDPHERKACTSCERYYSQPNWPGLGLPISAGGDLGGAGRRQGQK